MKSKGNILVFGVKYVKPIHKYSCALTYNKTKNY